MMSSKIVPLLCTISIVVIGVVFGNETKFEIGTPLAIQDNDNITILQNTICLSNINQVRANNGKGPVSVNVQVESAAYNHNSWMVRNNCFSHQCPGEPGLGDRLSSTGYTWSGIGEILAKGQGDCVAAVNAWLGSQGHRDIMLGNYGHVGCSGLTCNNCPDAGPWWTCVFANPR